MSTTSQTHTRPRSWPPFPGLSLHSIAHQTRFHIPPPLPSLHSLPTRPSFSSANPQSVVRPPASTLTLVSSWSATSFRSPAIQFALTRHIPDGLSLPRSAGFLDWPMAALSPQRGPDILYYDHSRNSERPITEPRWAVLALAEDRSGAVFSSREEE